MRKDFNKLPRLIIKHIDVADCTFQDVHNELDHLIEDMVKLGNNDWKKLSQDVIVDYRIHIPKNYSAPLKRDVDNVNENREWYDDLVADTDQRAQALGNNGDSEVEDHDMDDSVSNNNNTTDANNNNDNKEDNNKNDNDTDIAAFVESAVTPADTSLPTTRFDTYIGLWSEWNPYKFMNKHRVLQKMKTFHQRKRKLKRVQTKITTHPSKVKYEDVVKKRIKRYHYKLKKSMWCS